MKRFTSFLCAVMLIALSASAMGNDARTKELKHRQAIMREAMIRNNGQLPMYVHAPQAKQQIYDLTILDKPYVSSNSYGDPQVYISMTSEENYGITIYINGITEMVNGQTYTKADMDDWSSVGNYNTYQYSSLSDASITWSMDEEGYERFEGFVADTLGNRYNFLYQEVPFAPTGDTLEVRYSRVGSFEYSTWSSYWNVSGYDNYGSGNPYSVYFALNTGSDSIIAGHYTEADFADPEGNHIYVSLEGKPSKNYQFLTADINIIERNDSLLLSAYCMAEDGNVYDIYIYYSDPKPLFHENISAIMTVDTSGIQWGSISFKGASADFELSLSLWISDASADYHGTYVYPDCYPSLYNKRDSTYCSVFSGSLTITAGENGDILTGKLLCWDNTEYEIYMTEGLPEKTRDEVIIMEGAGLYIYEDLHKFIIWGCNEDSSRVVSISIMSDTVNGVYTIDKIESGNSYIAYDMNIEGRVSDLFSLLNAEISVAYDEEAKTVVLAGTILAQSNYHASDVPEFTILIRGELTHPHLEFDTPDADFEAEYEYEITGAEQGMFLVQAENETSMAALIFIATPTATTLPAGEYNCSLKGEQMTVYTGYCDGQNVYASFFMDNQYNIWFPFAGTATIDANGVITFDALNSYDRTINVTLNPAQTAVENVEQNAVNTNKRIENGQLIIEHNGVKYNAIGAEIK